MKLTKDDMPGFLAVFIIIAQTCLIGGKLTGEIKFDWLTVLSPIITIFILFVVMVIVLLFNDDDDYKK